MRSQETPDHFITFRGQREREMRLSWPSFVSLCLNVEEVKMRCCQIDAVDHPVGFPLALLLKVHIHKHTHTHDASSVSMSDLS